MADIPTTVLPNIPPAVVEIEVHSAPPGRYRVLAWSGAEAGVGNAITGYQVYRSTSADGEYTALISVSSAETSGSVQVAAPTENGDEYHYKVATLAAVKGFDSEMSVASTYLICDTSVLGEPTSVTLDLTNVGPGAEATLNWSGAAHGYRSTTGSTTLAKRIDGYRIYRSTRPDEGYMLLMEVETAETFGSATVTAPEDNGETYYFRVRPGLGSGSAQFPGQIILADDTVMSRAVASLTCTHSAPSAPARVTVNGSGSVYVLPGSTVTLEWSGAAPGANNDIVGYDVLRDGVVYAEGLAPDVNALEVPAHDTAGNSYTYTVVTHGEHGAGTPSDGVTVYSYSEPTAPQTVTAEEAETYAGARVLLNWSGAAPGGYNAIVGYRVYRSDTVNGAQTLVASVDSTESEASCYVDAPSTEGGVYYFRVATAGAYSVGPRSTTYATVKAVSDGAGGEGGGTGGDGDVTVIIKPTTWQKRKLVIGDYDTALDGWTLASLSFAEPEPVTNYVSIPWRADGPLDASDSPTNGDPRFGSRSLVATLELSEGTRDDRNEIISRMTNRLHGWRKQIVLPDDPSRYVVGRVKVRKLYSDMAHAAVEITAVCEPWRYKATETCLELLVSEDASTAVISNAGRKVLVPELTVTGHNARVELSTGDFAWALTPGTYRLPDLRLPTGDTLLTYSGSGLVMIKYREAIL